MPHLAPLSWALATVLFWLLLIALSASLWWQQTPSIPSQPSSSKTLSSSQKWSW